MPMDWSRTGPVGPGAKAFRAAEAHAQKLPQNSSQAPMPEVKEPKTAAQQIEELEAQGAIVPPELREDAFLELVIPEENLRGWVRFQDTSLVESGVLIKRLAQALFETRKKSYYQDLYIDLLNRDARNNAGFLYAHGIRGVEADIEEGRRLRALIGRNDQGVRM